MSIATKVGKYAFVPYHHAFFANKGQYFARGAKTPQKGDLIIFQHIDDYGNVTETDAHIGLVDYVSNGRVYTVEGNTSGASGVVSNGGGVAEKSYSLTYLGIQGYGRPAYANGEAEKVLAVAKKWVGYLEKATDAYLEDKTKNAGYNNYTIFGKWYGMNPAAWCDIFVSYCAAKADEEATAVEGWVTDSKGKWYRYADGTWPSSSWVKLSGKWYYFDDTGYLATNQWQWYKNNLYYLGSDGVMVTGKTLKIDSEGRLVPA